MSRSRRCLTLTLTLPLTRRCLFGEYRLPLLRTPYMLIGAPHMPCIQCVAVIGAPSQSSMRTHPCKCSACTLHVLYTACIVHCMCTARTLHRRAVRHVPARPRPGSVRPLGLRAERRGRARVRVALRHSDGALRAPPRSGATACLLEPVRPPAARRRIAPPHRAARIHIHTHIAPPPTTTLRRNPRLFFLPPPAPIPTPGATATQ